VFIFLVAVCLVACCHCSLLTLNPKKHSSFLSIVMLLFLQSIFTFLPSPVCFECLNIICVHLSCSFKLNEVLLRAAVLWHYYSVCFSRFSMCCLFPIEFLSVHISLKIYLWLLSRFDAAVECCWIFVVCYCHFGAEIILQIWFPTMAFTMLRRWMRINSGLLLW